MIFAAIYLNISISKNKEISIFVRPHHAHITFDYVRIINPYRTLRQDTLPNLTYLFRKENKMKNLNIKETRNVNGGGRYYCKVCGYTNNNYARVFAHCATHVKAWGPRWAGWASAVIRIMKNF